jgi:hypothetical protein
MEKAEENKVKILLQAPGKVLIFAGLADIGIMIYCIINKVNYSSSFNIFAVIAGILLLRGSLKTANIAAKFLALFIGMAAIILPYYLITMPVDYIVVSFKLHPGNMIFTVLIITALCVFMIWTYKALTTPAILKILEEQKIITKTFWKQPKAGFAAGVVLGAALSALLFFMFSGPMKEMIESKAKEQTGPGYKYHIVNFNSSNANYRATVAAYNDDEIKEVEINSSM